MTPTRVRGAVRYTAALIAGMLLAVPASAQQATTTGVVRGVVTGPDGAPVNGATVVATNEETGVRRGMQSDGQGRYQIPFLDPGRYTVRAQMIGYRAVERQGVRIAIGQVERLDFNLQSAPVQLEAQVAVAEAAPLIETTKTGTNTRISETQIAELPTNGRNFKDLVVLAPGTSDVGNLGSGGGQSIGGGRTGASNILMDGANNNESFFGGDARGGDRAPFSYSIEAVKEIQVITAGYDVERGNFTGGTVNAVTKSGTNEFHGALFGYTRQDSLGGLRTTYDDFLGRPPVDFQKRQYGFALGGPIIKDRLHFFVTLDKQTANEPRGIFAGIDASLASVFGIHPDTLQRVIDTAQSRYGFNLAQEIGDFAQNTDEEAFFGRIDWQIGNGHTLTLRDNFTRTNLSKDRLAISQSSTDFLSNSGDNTDESNSFVAALTSTFGGGLSNELRVQHAYENKPRPPYVPAGFSRATPQVRIINARSSPTLNTRLVFGADSILHANNLEQATLEVIDNVRLTRGNHTYKVGVNYLHVDVYNLFFNNSLGTFTFNTLADFYTGTPTAYTRALPFPGQGPPEARYDVHEAAIYAQDEWQVTPRLFLTYGLRYDYGWFPSKPPRNDAFSTAFPGLDVQDQPEDRNNIAPRFGFTYDVSGNGNAIVRGGTGLFYGRTPYVLWSNALLNTGRNQLALVCTTAGTIPVPDFQQYDADPSTIPSTCAGGGTGGAQPKPVLNLFDKSYEQANAWKTNLAYDFLVVSDWRLTIEGIYSRIRDNYLVQDDNLLETPAFNIEGGIPVFVRGVSSIGAGNARITADSTRRDPNYSNVLVHRSVGETKSFQGILQLRGRTPLGEMYASYTYDNTYDNGSIPCCTTGTMFRTSRAAGNPNNYDDQWGPGNENRRHTIVVAPQFDLPYGFKASAIFRTFSGIPYTPRYFADINGDGQDNDRMYVPTPAEVSGYLFGPAGSTPTALQEQARQRGLFEQKIEQTECLRENRGEIIGRNACRSPWQNVLDARISKEFPTIRGQNVELVADFFNVLNGLNSEWGRRRQVSSNDERLLNPVGFDPTTQRFRYTVNESFGRITPADNFQLAQFQMQLGARYNF